MHRISPAVDLRVTIAGLRGDASKLALISPKLATVGQIAGRSEISLDISALSV